MKRCIIIGASPETDIDIIKKTVNKDDFVVCADGGYTFAVSAGIIPNMIIGDFDSSDFPENMDCKIDKLPVMKDDTDTNYCVKKCIEMGFKNFILIGMTGGRNDHTFANYCTLKYLADKKLNAEIIDKNISVSILNKGTKNIANSQNKTFSIFPFSCEFCTVSLSGFLYELDRGMLKSDFPLGVSNTITSENAKITVHNGCAIIMISDN